jgi:hypothetical protein
LLDTNPALRSRYCELALTVVLPPLRRMREILATKSHLNESIAPARLDPLLPGIGRNWISHTGSLTSVFYHVCTYAAQFESLAGRWGQERYDLLQPASPSPSTVMFFIIAEQLKDVGKKEVELVGMSSGSGPVGRHDYMKGGAALLANAQTAET